MQTRYRIGEVEKILGIPRSTIHFYIKKGYLSIDKDQSNGYRYYSRRDLREIMHLIVGRSNLHLDLDRSYQRTKAKSLGDFRELFYTQEEMLTKRMTKDRRTIEVLNIYHRMLTRIERYENQCLILEPGKIHLFPEDFIFQAHTSVIDVGFTTSVFRYHENTLLCDGIRSLVFDRDSYLVSVDDFAQKEETILPQRYLYTVVKSDKDMENVALLTPAFAYAKNNHMRLKPPYYLCYLFQVEEGGKKQYYYDMYLPLEEEPV